MAEVFIGSEAIAAGRLTRHELRRWYRPIYRGVYVPNGHDLSLRDRITAAVLSSGRRGVVAGVAASALHGAQWVDGDIPVELIARSSRPQCGLMVRNEALAGDEITGVAGIPVTTLARTAFDLGRHLPLGQAVARLDALMRATPFSIEDVLMLEKRYTRTRGLRRLREALPLVDGGAASPQETRVRLVLIEAGFPRPTTQIAVVEGRGRLVRMLDMGWEDIRVAVEYDGDQHRSDRRQYVKDMSVLRKLERMGWIVIRVIAEDCDDDIIARVDEAFIRRGLHRD